MSAHLKPPNAKARALLRKLQALAERGIDGERTSALAKIARLKKRFDFSLPDPAETPDLFLGTFKRSTKASRIYVFDRSELDVANSVKWAIESVTKIPCLYRDGALLAEAAPGTASRLAEIAAHIANSFRTLLGKFSAVDGVSVDDRCAFVMGLYDGMMNEARGVGERLPSRYGPTKMRKRERKAASSAASLHIHPYTIALSLGKQIRFSAPLAQIAAELETVTQKGSIGRVERALNSSATSNTPQTTCHQKSRSSRQV